MNKEKYFDSHNSSRKVIVTVLLPVTRQLLKGSGYVNHFILCFLLRKLEQAK